MLCFVACTTTEVDDAEALALDTEVQMGLVPVTLPSDRETHFFYTVEIAVESTAFFDAMDLLRLQLREAGVLGEQIVITDAPIDDPRGERSADFSFYMPVADLLGFIAFVEENYTLIRLDQRVMEVPDVLGEMGGFADINLRLYEVMTQERLDEIAEAEALEDTYVQEPFPERVRRAFGTTITALLFVLQVFALFLLAILPWMLLLAAILVLIHLIGKWNTKRKVAKFSQQNKSQTSQHDQPKREEAEQNRNDCGVADDETISD